MLDFIGKHKATLLKIKSTRLPRHGLGLIIIVLIPCIAILSLGYDYIQSQWEFIRITQEMRVNGKLLEAISLATHALQQEKISLLYDQIQDENLNANGIITDIAVLHENTDLAVQNFFGALQNSVIPNMPEISSDEILQRLHHYRTQAEDRQFLVETNEGYAKLITDILAINANVVASRTHMGIGKLMGQLALMQHARESAAKLRSTLLLEWPEIEKTRQVRSDLKIKLYSLFVQIEQYIDSPVRDVIPAEHVHAPGAHLIQSKEWQDIHELIDVLVHETSLSEVTLLTSEQLFEFGIKFVFLIHSKELADLQYLVDALDRLESQAIHKIAMARFWLLGSIASIVAIGILFFLLLYQRARLENTLKTLRDQDAHVKLLAMVASSTKNAVIVLDAEGKVEWVNAGCEAITGYSMQEMSGKRLESLLQGPETSRRSIALYRNSIRRGESSDMEILFYSKKEEHVWLILSTQPVLDGDNTITHFISIGNDITAQKKFNLLLEEREERFRKTLEQQQGMIFSIELQDGKFVHTMCRGKMLKRMALTPEQVEGHTLYDFLPAHVAEIKEKYYMQAWEGAEVTYEGSSPNGLFYLAQLEPHIVNGKTVEVIASCVDI